MKNIVISRIDDRLIHGQVATQWLKTFAVDTVLIPDDKLVNDSFMQRILKSAAPAGLKVVIFNVEDSIKWLKEENDSKEVFIIAKTPFEFEKIIDAGFEIKDIVLGNMAKNAQRQTFIKQCSASVEEIECFKRILSKGTNVFYQMVPSQSKVDIKDAIK